MANQKPPHANKAGMPGAAIGAAVGANPNNISVRRDLMPGASGGSNPLAAPGVPSAAMGNSIPGGVGNPISAAGVGGQARAGRNHAMDATDGAPGGQPTKAALKGRKRTNCWNAFLFR